MKHLLARLLRTLVLGVALSSVTAMAAAAASNAIEVYHDPACGCCVNWIRYMQAHGYSVTSHDDQPMAVVKVE